MRKRQGLRIRYVQSRSSDAAPDERMVQVIGIHQRTAKTWYERTHTTGLPTDIDDDGIALHLREDLFVKQPEVIGTGCGGDDQNVTVANQVLEVHKAVEA